MEEKIINLSNGEEIFYLESGKEGGQAVLFIHGNMSSSTHMIPLMEAVEDQYKLYALDMPGFGQSSYNTVRRDILSYAQCIQDWIIEMNLKELRVIAWSLGGAVALELAAISSLEQVKDLFLIAPIGIHSFRFEPISNMVDSIEKDDILDFDFSFEKVKEIFSPMKEKLENKEEKQDLKTEVLCNYYMFKKKKPEIFTYDKYIKASLQQKNHGDIIHSIYNFNMTPEKFEDQMGSGRIEEIKQKVVIVHGSDDLVVSCECAYDTVGYLGDKASLVEVEDGGHFLFFEEYDQVVGLLKGFLEGKEDFFPRNEIYCKDKEHKNKKLPLRENWV